MKSLLTFLGPSWSERFISVVLVFSLTLLSSLTLN